MNWFPGFHSFISFLTSAICRHDKYESGGPFLFKESVENLPVTETKIAEEEPGNSSGVGSE